jgi:hypothetical protein
MLRLTRMRVPILKAEEAWPDIRDMVDRVLAYVMSQPYPELFVVDNKFDRLEVTPLVTVKIQRLNKIFWQPCATTPPKVFHFIAGPYTQTPYPRDWRDPRAKERLQQRELLFRLIRRQHKSLHNKEAAPSVPVSVVDASEPGWMSLLRKPEKPQPEVYCARCRAAIKGDQSSDAS